MTSSCCRARTIAKFIRLDVEAARSWVAYSPMQLARLGDLDPEPVHKLVCVEAASSSEFLWLAFRSAGKSITFVYLVAWLAIVPPERYVARGFPLVFREKRVGPEDLRVAVVCASENLARARVNGIRSVLDSEAVTALYGVVKSSPWSDSKAVTSLRRGQAILDGTFAAVAVQQSVAGRRADLLLIDDADGEQAATSPATRERTRAFVSTTLRPTRAGSHSVTWCLATRWHDEDLAGTMLREAEHTGLRSRVTPAVVTVDGFEKSATPRLSIDWLRRERARDPRSFALQYQCVEPLPEVQAGGVFDHVLGPDRFVASPRDGALYRAFQVDPARAGEGDPNGRTGRDEMGLAVVDLYPGPRAVIVAALGAVHRTPQDQLKFVLGAVKRFQPRGYPIALVVESIAAGSWIEAELEMCALRSADDVLFKSVSPTSLPTWWRVKRLAQMMEDGLVHLVAGGEGIDRLVNQARAYPTTQKAGDDLLSAASLVAIPTLTRAPRRASYHGTTLTPYRRP